MKYFAKVENNLVTQVIVADDSDTAEKLESMFGGLWIESFVDIDSNPRKNPANNGSLYSPEKDIFSNPQPFESWTLDENFDWQPPIAKPEGAYYWDEETLSWVETPAE
jgi:hypothetical protein